jgi:hypothetical protein
MTADVLLPASAQIPSDRQRLFLRYYTGTLIDLVVLGLFADWTDKVIVESFSIGILAAVLLQILLKLTIVVEHKALERFKGKAGIWWTSLKYLVAWLILFGSKFVILKALTVVFGDKVRFEGAWHGIVWLIIVVVTMVIVEELVVRFYRKLA